jgi:hypothetical protein
LGGNGELVFELVYALKGKFEGYGVDGRHCGGLKSKLKLSVQVQTHLRQIQQKNLLQNMSGNFPEMFGVSKNFQT